MLKYITFCVFLLFTLAKFSFTQNSRVLDSLNVALDITNNSKQKAEILLDIAEEYAEYQYDSAMYYTNEALLIAEKIEDDELLASANMQMGNNFFWQGNFNRVIVFYFKVLRYWESIDAKKMLPTIYFNVGLVYDNMDDELKAREYYMKSLQALKKLADEDSIFSKTVHFARLYNNIGVTYSDMNDYEKALEYYNKSIKYAEVTGIKNALHFAYNNKGNVYKSEGKYDLALSFYDKSLSIRKEKNDFKGIALTYFYIGECYSLMGEKDEAIKYYLKGFDIAESTNYLQLQKDISEKLSEEYALKQDFENSYAMHVVFKEMNDSLNFIESSRTATMLEMEYEYDKFKKQKETERKRRELIYSIIALILFSVVCIITLLYILARNKTRQIRLKQENLKLEKRQLKQELEFKNKELATNVMYLFRKNELNNQVVEKLLNLKYELKKSNQKPLNDIILELQSSIDADVWEEFELRFQQVHESFYENLNYKFPDLTSNEKRLCAFLKLNMTTKEIAAITQKSLHSIDVARTRLRKKLNLTNTDTEISTFLSQL